MEDLPEFLSRIRPSPAMLHRLGMLMQFAALVFLPMLSFWQIEFGIPLIVMPACLTIAAIVFFIGTRLRESK
ncbi:MAG: hypothetical protein IT428_20270 [Planctomycetaceae bacterium]|nr:hypothetical protein [Planctomycetaceae bacterium]